MAPKPQHLTPEITVEWVPMSPERVVAWENAQHIILRLLREVQAEEQQLLISFPEFHHQISTAGR